MNTIKELCIKMCINEAGLERRKYLRLLEDLKEKEQDIPNDSRWFHFYWRGPYGGNKDLLDDYMMEHYYSLLYSQ